MSTRDIVNNVVERVSLAPAARTAAANGTGVDTRGYRSAAFIVEFGAVSDGYFTTTAQESDDNVSFTDVAAADLDGTMPTAFGESPDSGASVITKVGYKGSKRYVRVQIAQGLSPAPSVGCLARASILLGHPEGAPAAST